MIDRKWIGHELPPARATLERGRLRFFAQTIGEADPVYTDVAAARAAGYADLPAPPTFLMSVDLDAGTIDAMLTLLQVPIARILHGEQGYTYHRAVCAGDSVTVRSRIADIQAKKGGALELIVKTSETRNQHDELVMEQRSVIVVRN